MAVMLEIRRFLRDLGQLYRSIRKGETDIPYADLRRSESQFRALAENATDIIWSMDFPGSTTYVSPASKRILGWSHEEQVRREGGTTMLTPDSAARAQELMGRAIADRAPVVQYEAEHYRADGTTVWCEVRQTILYDDEGRPVSCVGISRDTSEERAIRQKLMRSQKLDALGLIAGGMAHDFNNFLTVIMGALETALAGAEKHPASSDLIGEAIDATERASALTGQLLAHSRNEAVAVHPIAIDEVVGRARPMLERLVGDTVQIDFELGGAAVTLFNETQLVQILLNLVANARDALGDGSRRITISTAGVFVDRASVAQHPVPVSGAFSVLTVSDEGTGMTPETLERATEPFFTTKAEGLGTGLGLSTVEKVVRQAGGALELVSAPGEGTAVRVYLPTSERDDAVGKRAASASRTEASEVAVARRVLVVDDEPTVRRVAARILERAGFEVSTASGEAAAVALFETQLAAGEAPDVLLTDLNMHGPGGIELARRLKELHAPLRIVLMSGYAEDLAGVELPGPLIQKPFQSGSLVRGIEGVFPRV